MFYGKVACYYCECYVDVDTNNFCPQCGAPLGKSIDRDVKQEYSKRRQKYDYSGSPYFVDGGHTYRGGLR